MASITATLPILLLDRIDRLIEEDKVPSRSFLIREAVSKYLERVDSEAK